MLTKQDCSKSTTRNFMQHLVLLDRLFEEALSLEDTAVPPAGVCRVLEVDRTVLFRG